MAAATPNDHVMLKIFVIAVLTTAGVGVLAPAASARPLPCVQYNDPVHMGSYEVCPLG
jgi:hypothetical protein